jgi:hypothetical protein
MQMFSRRFLVTSPPGPDTSGDGDASTLGMRDSLHRELLAQCDAMMRHAMGAGVEVPPDLLGRLDVFLAPAPPPPGADGSVTLNGPPVSDLTEIHKTLAGLVAPATPAAILLFAREQAAHPVLCSVGPVPLMRHFLLLSAVSLVALLAVSLSDQVNDQNLSRTLLNLSGFPLMMVEIFLLSAASMGSCFAILQKLNGYIAAGVYDPKYQATYWGRWMMGVISGIILSQLFFPFFSHPLDDAGQPVPSNWLPSDVGQPMLALLGGYSASLVQRLIQKVMQAIESLFGGEK